MGLCRADRQLHREDRRPASFGGVYRDALLFLSMTHGGDNMMVRWSDDVVQAGLQRWGGPG